MDYCLVIGALSHGKFYPYLLDILQSLSLRPDPKAKSGGGNVNWMAPTEDRYGQTEGAFCGYQIKDVNYDMEWSFGEAKG